VRSAICKTGNEILATEELSAGQRLSDGAASHCGNIKKYVIALGVPEN